MIGRFIIRPVFFSACDDVGEPGSKILPKSHDGFDPVRSA